LVRPAFDYPSSRFPTPCGGSIPISATSFVPDDVVAQLCEALGLVGTPAECAARIVDMTKLGVRNLYLMTLQTFAPPEPEIAAFRDVVFPRLHAVGLRSA
jgi:hypothetical protein